MRTSSLTLRMGSVLSLCRRVPLRPVLTRAFFPPPSQDVVEAIKGVTNGGAHAAIVVASGAAAYNQALQYLRPNGALVAVGLPKDAAINAEIFPTVLRSLRIIGVRPQFFRTSAPTVR